MKYAYHKLSYVVKLDGDSSHNKMVVNRRVRPSFLTNVGKRKAGNW